MTVNNPSADRYDQLGRMFADVLDRGWELYYGQKPAPMIAPVVITGAGLGLPGHDQLFDDANIAALLNGEQGIDVIPPRSGATCSTSTSPAW